MAPDPLGGPQQGLVGVGHGAVAQQDQPSQKLRPRAERVVVTGRAVGGREEGEGPAGPPAQAGALGGPQQLRSPAADQPRGLVADRAGRLLVHVQCRSPSCAVPERHARSAATPREPGGEPRGITLLRAADYRTHRGGSPEGSGHDPLGAGRETGDSTDARATTPLLR
ncbi:hypothetical protein ACFV08_22830 [Streptomyces fradiae]|uniref:hypothetical protein n=1 Tax=Streptomyces fradiae TaxID=1906 RepID=UPI00368447C0